jgi:hypothetical protein
MSTILYSSNTIYGRMSMLNGSLVRSTRTGVSLRPPVPGLTEGSAARVWATSAARCSVLRLLGFQRHALQARRALPLSSRRLPGPVRLVVSSAGLQPSSYSGQYRCRLRVGSADELWAPGTRFRTGDCAQGPTTLSRRLTGSAGSPARRDRDARRLNLPSSILPQGDAAARPSLGAPPRAARTSRWREAPTWPSSTSPQA